MADAIRPLGTEGVCNTVANAYTNSTVSAAMVKLTNIDTVPHLITIAFANALTYATTTVLANTELYVQKNYTDLMSSNAATAVVLATVVKRGTV